MTPQKVNLADAFASFFDPWSPRVAGDINAMQVKLGTSKNLSHFSA